MKNKDKYIEKFYNQRMDIDEKDYGPREEYWEACNILRDLIKRKKATRGQILGELEEDL